MPVILKYKVKKNNILISGEHSSNTFGRTVCSTMQRTLLLSSPRKEEKKGEESGVFVYSWIMLIKSPTYYYGGNSKSDILWNQKIIRSQYQLQHPSLLSVHHSDLNHTASLLLSSLLMRLVITRMSQHPPVSGDYQCDDSLGVGVVLSMTATTARHRHRVCWL